MSTSYQPHVTFLLGKPLRVSSVIAHVIQRLHRQAPMITVYRPVPGGDLPPQVLQSDLVVQRGLHGEELTTAIRLEEAGIRCVNSAMATHNLGDRAVVMSLLAAAALPIPETATAPSWKEVIEVTGRRPVAVKAVDGRIGRGQRVLLSPDGNLPGQAPFNGPFVVQDYVPANATVRKLYVVGNHTRALVKDAGAPLPPEGSGVPVEIEPGLANLARHAGIALGMEIYGVDFLYDFNGPKIIDVNPFPGFRNVPDAARLIAKHLSGIVTTCSHNSERRG